MSETEKLPNRKPTRLNKYDYSAPGAYFITICTRERKQILSTITVGDGVLDVPQNILSNYGKIAEKYILQMDEFYKQISVDKYIIMPNHIHLIITIKKLNNYPINGMSGTPSPTNSVIPKFISTLKRFCNKEYNENIWQRSYHDHIIRGEADYRKIWEYIDTNALKWEEDCFYND